MNDLEQIYNQKCKKRFEHKCLEKNVCIKYVKSENFFFIVPYKYFLE